jgi:hypothetical protein
MTKQKRAAEKPGFNDAESPLSWLHGRNLITSSQYLAGEKLRADFERAMLAGRVTTNWDAAGGGSRGGNVAAGISDGAIAARQRYHRAMEAVGPELGPILRQVCCMAAGIEAAERALDLPRRSGRAVLGLALTGLARHYGLFGSSARQGAVRAWGAEDYRPAIPETEDA